MYVLGFLKVRHHSLWDAGLSKQPGANLFNFGRLLPVIPLLVIEKTRQALLCFFCRRALR